MWCVEVTDRDRDSVAREHDSSTSQAVDGYKVWRFSSQVFKSSVPDGGRLWNVALELELWEARTTSSETCVSWDSAIVGFWDYVPDRGFSSEGCR